MESVFRKSASRPPPMKSSSTSLDDDYPLPDVAMSSSGSHSPGSLPQFPAPEHQLSADIDMKSETWVPVDFGEPTDHTETVVNEKEGTKRRQKRLERNRESARESRRRRKQYLEVLEERVNELSYEMDKLRRGHVSKAISTIMGKRTESQSFPPELSRTAHELSVVNTFNHQQLRGFATPQCHKLVLWLTLQNDMFFRGGRAASERLSAARIGERMLNNGTDQVSPSQAMWPLLCNEINLSYDQEEKVRLFQRTILQSQDSWVDRHAVFAATKTMESVHDAVQALHLRLGQRERRNVGILSPEQREKFLSFASKNKGRLRESVASKVSKSTRFDGKYDLKEDQHVSANLYIINSRVASILDDISRGANIVSGKALKKLARRPCFETLGCRSGTDKKDNEDRAMSLDRSFSSTGSLKRSASEISMDSSEDKANQLPPETAELAARPFVEQVLGHVKDIIPVMPQSMLCSADLGDLPSPTPISMMQPPVGHGYPEGHEGMLPEEPETKHQRRSSFFPAHLNVVPEEMWPTDTATDDLLTTLADEDWAIGEGFHMDF